jgi:tetratricopeptide (TPR) repeat protein
MAAKAGKANLRPATTGMARAGPVRRRAYVANGDLIKAIDVFEKGIEKLPTNAELFIEIGLVHMAMKRYDRAIKILQTAIEAETVFPPSLLWQHLSEAYVADNDLDGALRTLHMAIEKFPLAHYFWIRFCEVCNFSAAGITWSNVHGPKRFRKGHKNISEGYCKIP